jgi:hypothetical protein
MVEIVMSLMASFGLAANDHINQANYDGIRIGMQLSQVRKVMTRSGVDVMSVALDEKTPYSNREILDIQEVGYWNHKPDDNDPGRRWFWRGWNGVIAIRVDQDNRVTDRMFIKLKPSPHLPR